MTITDQILEKDRILRRYNEGLWDREYNPDIVGFSSFNDAGVECETGEFLAAMTRLLKPDNVLETGTHWGVSATYIGYALRENKKGHLDTYEFLSEIHKVASDRIVRHELQEQVSVHLGDVANLETNLTYGLIFLDTEPQTRFSELLRFYGNLAEGGFVFIHDLHRHMHQIPNEEHGFAWPYGPVPEDMKALVRNGALRPIHFSTPRGFTGFYKVHRDDYKF